MVQLRRQKNNPLFVGEAGVGKTAIAEGLARRIVHGEVPDVLRNATVFALDIPAPTIGVWEESQLGIVLNEHYEGDGEIIFKHACELGCEGIVSKRLGSPYRSGRSPLWLKVKNPNAPAVTREAEENWGR
jgi:hypothetical protein